MSGGAVALREVQSVRELLRHPGASKQLAECATRELSPERLMKLAVGALRTSPKLGECDPMSFLGALMTCSSLGLEPNTVLGHAYLIPFKNGRKSKMAGRDVYDAQLVIGYKGYIALARRSGDITSISAGVHYSDDELWKYENGTESILRHREGPQDGEKVHAYAVAIFKDGGHAKIVLPWKIIMRTRDASQGWKTALKFGKQKESPWHTHEDQMAMKTCIRRLTAFLPLAVEMATAAAVDGAKPDYADVAMNPDMVADIGSTIEGTFSEAEGVLDEEDAPAAEPTEKPKQTKKESKPWTRKAKAEAAPPPLPPEPEPEPKFYREPAPEPDAAEGEAPEAPDEPGINEVTLAQARDAGKRILEDLAELTSDEDAVVSEVEMIMATFAQQLNLIRQVDPDLAAKIDAKAEEVSEHLAERGAG